MSSRVKLLESSIIITSTHCISHKAPLLRANLSKQGLGFEAAFTFSARHYCLAPPQTPFWPFWRYYTWRVQKMICLVHFTLEYLNSKRASRPYEHMQRVDKPQTGKGQPSGQRQWNVTQCYRQVDWLRGHGREGRNNRRHRILCRVQYTEQSLNQCNTAGPTWRRNDWRINTFF